MNKLKTTKCFLMLFLLCMVASPASAQEGFKGIIPIKSNCEDVKRILGGQCNSYYQNFNLPEERVSIYYSTKPCRELDDNGRRWNVPIGTVLQISRTIKKAAPPEKLGIVITESEYYKYQIVNELVKYKKKGGGLEVSFAGEYVTNIYYTPTNEDNSRICPISTNFGEIIPMKTTCHDLVKLGIGLCDTNEQIFDQAEESLKFIYTTKKCESFYGKRWNVPIGTIARIERRFRTPRALEEQGIQLNESEYEKIDNDIGSVYKRKNGGLILIILNQKVSEIIYTPTLENYTQTCFKNPK